MWSKKYRIMVSVVWLVLVGGLIHVIAQGLSASMASGHDPSPWEGQVPLVREMDTDSLIGKGYQRTIFAGGCFWCMQAPFDRMKGVMITRAGYAGGTEKMPLYQDVAYGRTSHTEAVEVWYDPQLTSFGELVEKYWQTMDPTDLGGQFADRGKQYRPAIFVMNLEERTIAEASKTKLQASDRFNRPVVVPIEDYSTFYPAEEYHQFYYIKDARAYKRYRIGSGREAFLNKTWK